MISVVMMVARVCASANQREPKSQPLSAAARICRGIDLPGVAPAGARQLAVMPIRLIPWAVAVIPVAVEHRAFGEGHDATLSRAGPQALRALHPEGVLAPELREKACEGGGWVVAREQAHHFEEERRLRAGLR